jgi:hypothetical protein
MGAGKNWQTPDRQSFWKKAEGVAANEGRVTALMPPNERGSLAPQAAKLVDGEQGHKGPGRVTSFGEDFSQSKSTRPNSPCDPTTSSSHAIPTLLSTLLPDPKQIFRARRFLTSS